MLQKLKNTVAYFDMKLIGLHHPLDGLTNPEYKLLRFIQLTIFLQREEGTSFLLGEVLPPNALFTVDPLPFYKNPEWI